MSDMNFNVVIKQRIDLKANWETNNPRLKLGEIGIAVSDETDEETGVTTRNYRMKIGDGAHDWSDLPYWTYNKPEIDSMIVKDGAMASKVLFSNDKFTSKNVSAALLELYSYISNVETEMKDLNDEAFEIAYSSDHSGLTTITNLQQFADYVTDYLTAYVPTLAGTTFDNTGTGLVDDQGVPITSSQTAFDMLYAITPKNAADLSYQNALSGLSATQVQAAIDELVQNIADLSASAIAYTNNPDETTATNVQDCLGALWTEIHTIYSYGVSKKLESFDYDNTVTQIRIDESDPTVYDTLNAQGVLEYCIKRFNAIVQDLDSAIGVTFDPTNTKIAVGSNLQATTEQLDTALYNLKQYVESIKADQVIYDNSDPDKVVTVKGEIDSLDGRIETNETFISNINATKIPYSNSSSGMTATTTQAAIDELDSRVDSLVLDAEHVSYDDSVSQLSDETTTVDNVQKAIVKLDSNVDTIADTLDDFDGTTLSKFTTNTDGDLMWGTTKIGGTDDTFHKKASEISYDNTVKAMLTSTTAQGAIDDLAQKDKDTNDKIDALTGTDIDYSNTTSGLTATNIQGAIDELDSSVDTLLQDNTDTNQRIDDLDADDIAFTATTTISQTTVQSAIEHIDETVQAVILDLKAENISYDDTTTVIGTDIDTVQKAIEGLDSKLDTLELKAEKISYDNTTSGSTYTNVQASIDDLYKLKNATNINYTNTSSGLTATKVQGAIDELDGRLDTIESWTSDNIKYTTQDTSSSALTSTNVRSALDEVNTKLDTIAANKNTAGDITYDNVSGKITDPTATNVQSAIDVLADKISGTEGKISNKASDIVLTEPSTSSLTSLNAQSAFEEIAGRLDNVEDASGVSYDPSGTGTQGTPLTSTDVQAAITEVNGKLDTIAANKNTAKDITYAPTETSQFKSGTVADVIQEISDKLTNAADDISYDNSETGIDADTVQEAIDNILGGLDTVASDIEYDTTGTSLTGFDNAQTAITELAARTDTIPKKLADITYDSTNTGWTNIKNGQEIVDALSESEHINFDNTYAQLTDDAGNPVDNMQDAMDALANKYAIFSGQKAAYVSYDPTTSGRTESTTVQNAIDRAFSEIDQAVAKIFDHAEDIIYENEDYPSLTNVKLALDRLLKQVFYALPEITSFTATTHHGTTTSTDTTYEIGYSINSVDFAWAVNKTLKSQLLTGCSVTATDTSATYSTTFSTNKDFKLVCEDNETDSSGNYNTVSKTISFKFLPKVYYGAATEPTTYDSDFVLGLSSSALKESRVGTYNFNAGTDEYCYIAWPTSYGTNLTEVTVGGFATSITSCGQFSVTNAQSYTQTYIIYRLNQTGLGSIDMVVS